MSAWDPQGLTPVQRAWMRELGMDLRALGPSFRTSRPTTVPGAAARAVPLKPAVRRTLPPAAPAAAVAPIVREQPLAPTLAGLNEQAVQCRACDLHQARGQVVFGAGAQTGVQWLIVGEAPGARDDRKGLPFQGPGGKLLDAMLAAIGVQDRSGVYATNLVKCRPLGNAAPTPEQIAACRPFLEMQIRLLQPVRILAMGKLAAQALLGSTTDLESLRGKVHAYHAGPGLEIPLIATYHPGFLLSNPQCKAGAWRDLVLANAGPVHGPADRSGT